MNGISVKPVSDVRFGMEEGGVGCPSVNGAQVAPIVVFPGKDSSSLVVLSSL